MKLYLQSMSADCLSAIFGIHNRCQKRPAPTENENALIQAFTVRRRGRPSPKHRREQQSRANLPSQAPIQLRPSTRVIVVGCGGCGDASLFFFTASPLLSTRSHSTAQQATAAPSASARASPSGLPPPSLVLSSPFLSALSANANGRARRPLVHSLHCSCLSLSLSKVHATGEPANGRTAGAMFLSRSS